MTFFAYDRCQSKSGALYSGDLFELASYNQTEMYDSGRIINDSIYSMRIPENVFVEMFNGENFDSDSLTL